MFARQIQRIYSKKISRTRPTTRFSSTAGKTSGTPFNSIEKIVLSSIFVFASYNFYQFVVDNPLALQVAIDTAKKNEELQKRMGADIESPFFKRVFWNGSVDNGKVDINVPVVSNVSGKEAIVKGKGLQDIYGKNKVWFFSLYAELRESGEKIDLIKLSEEEINEGKVNKNSAVDIPKQKKEIKKIQDKIDEITGGNRDKNARDI
jgi:hypothetical protein